MGIVTIKPNKHKTGFVYDRREQFLIDAEEDLVLLTKNAVAGSTAWLADCSKKYVLNSALEWVEENVGSGSVSGGSAGVFRVTLVAEYNGMEEVLVPDKTFREILDAVNAGMLPVVVCGEINSDGSIYLGTVYYLNYIDSNAYADFNALSGGNKLRCTVNNEWTV